ncbi:MAG: hypothetical protein PF542_04455 [Nanoarchaeota archaeon]|jgi:hypothetical protein|nr:hypothetical protein [Nanoarchaeota archaeon]
MAKDTKFNSKIKYAGVFNLKDFYQFCFKWMGGEMDLKVQEDEYEEKIKGNVKEVKIKWTGKAKVAEYFNYEVKVEFDIKQLAEVEIVTPEGKKIKTNQGQVKFTVKGIFIKDPAGQFESSAKTKFMRGIYEKFLIPSRIKEFEDKLIDQCVEFMSQAKAYLDLEGKL